MHFCNARFVHFCLVFSLLQHANSVLLPAITSIYFYDVTFKKGSDSMLSVAYFLQWRREQGFPVQKIKIFGDRKYVLSHIQDTVVEMPVNGSDTGDDSGRGQ
jgi:hypothetical protein